MTVMTCLLIGVIAGLALLIFQVWRLHVLIEEQNNEWIDYVKALGQLIEKDRAAASHEKKS